MSLICKPNVRHELSEQISQWPLGPNNLNISLGSERGNAEFKHSEKKQPISLTSDNKDYVVLSVRLSGTRNRKRSSIFI